jgi:hypothetical protein
MLLKQVIRGYIGIRAQLEYHYDKYDKETQLKMRKIVSSIDDLIYNLSIEEKQLLDLKYRDDYK